MHFRNKGLPILLISYIFFVASTCEEQIATPTSANDFNKEKREKLGKLVEDVISNSTRTFDILEIDSKKDSILYDYLQTLYNQVTFQFRLDRSSPPDNRWTFEREWKVFILASNNRLAFSIPGGNFYISTGLLKSLSRDYELYYLMAFEAVNVNNRYLLGGLISQYSSTDFLQIIEQPEQMTEHSLFEIAAFLQKDLILEDVIVQEIDKETANLICTTSIFNRLGIISILSILHQQEQWRIIRPSYPNRIEIIKRLNLIECGNIETTGAYRSKVLSNLPD